MSLAAAAAHHVSLIFGVVFFALPVLGLAVLDVRQERAAGSPTGVVLRAFAFAALAGLGVGVLLLPYWIEIIRHPIHQIPIPHDSRNNFLLTQSLD